MNEYSNNAKYLNIRIIRLISAYTGCPRGPGPRWRSGEDQKSKSQVRSSSENSKIKGLDLGSWCQGDTKTTCTCTIKNLLESQHAMALKTKPWVKIFHDSVDKRGFGDDFRVQVKILKTQISQLSLVHIIKSQ